MDLSNTVLDLASGSYTVTRIANQGFGTDGRLVALTPSTFKVKASVQPVNGRTLRILPEGLRTRELLAVFTATELFGEQAGNDPDTLTIDGLPYQVQIVERWGSSGNYFKAIVAKIGRTG